MATKYGDKPRAARPWKGYKTPYDDWLDASEVDPYRQREKWLEEAEGSAQLADAAEKYGPGLTEAQFREVSARLAFEAAKLREAMTGHDSYIAGHFRMATIDVIRMVEKLTGRKMSLELAHKIRRYWDKRANDTMAELAGAVDVMQCRFLADVAPQWEMEAPAAENPGPASVRNPEKMMNHPWVRNDAPTMGISGEKEDKEDEKTLQEHFMRPTRVPPMVPPARIMFPPAFKGRLLTEEERRGQAPASSSPNAKGDEEKARHVA